MGMSYEQHLFARATCCHHCIKQHEQLTESRKLQGGEDNAVAPADAQRLAAALQAAGVATKIEIFEGAGHELVTVSLSCLTALPHCTVSLHCLTPLNCLTVTVTV
jgi:predicted esterase